MNTASIPPRWAGTANTAAGMRSTTEAPFGLKNFTPPFGTAMSSLRESVWWVYVLSPFNTPRSPEGGALLKKTPGHGALDRNFRRTDARTLVSFVPRHFSLDAQRIV